MKYFYTTIIMILLLIVSHHANAETKNLQQMVDEAKDVLILPEGEYVANVTIYRPIKIVADGNVILKAANNNEPIVTVENAKEVSIEGIHFDTKNKAIQIKDSTNVSLSNLKIKKVHSGIELYRAKNVKIKNNTIIGNDKHYAQKGNGISVFNSREIEVEDNVIHRVQDGVYIEEVYDIIVKNNKVDNSRYGTHFMYSENAIAEGNVYTKNVTGLMVMMTKNIELLKNEVMYQEGFNGTGITLFDVENIVVAENKSAGNRIAVTLQKTKDVEMKENVFQMNQTAIESIKSDKSNLAAENYFVGNLVNVRSDSTGVTLKNNYYDDYSGIDLDDDGIGDEAYVGLQSFGQWMVRKPVYQYYVEAPSVVLLKEIDKVTNKSAKQLLVDESPMTDFKNDEHNQSKVNVLQLTLGLLLVIGCIVVWRRSVIV